MNGQLTDEVRRRNLPLGELIEPGCGFRLGAPELPFAMVSSTEDHWVSVSEDGTLRVDSQVRFLGSAMVISHRLANVGSQPSPPLHVIEPLYMVFRQPAASWRHISANGGTSEHYYPPTAYRTRDQCRSPRGLILESPPEGRSSNLHLPLLISLASVREDSEGLFCGMAWSAGWYIRAEPLGDTESALAVGVKVEGLRLEPGESLDLPEVHLGFFEGGPDSGTNGLRRHLYENVCAPYQGGPMVPRVSYDHWFGIGNDFDCDLLTAQAKRAAQLGVEVFSVDASWFAGAFPDGVGNWDEVDGDRFPRGLEPLAEHVRELGMEFGLWFEPERVAEGTSLQRQHPHWFVPVRSSRQRQAYHINLAIPEAQDYLIEMIGGWIRRLDLHWSRWDYNIDPQQFWEAVDPTMKGQFAYCQGLYRVLDTLIKEHPNWMVESCASGGRRIDIGTIQRSHTIWFSDQSMDPGLCRYMQARANRFLPGHLLNSSVAVRLGQGDAGFDDTAVLSRMLGKLAFDGDIASWSPGLTTRMAGWASEFKAIRHLMVQDFHQLLPTPTTIEDWDIVQFASYAADEAILFAFAGYGGRRRVRLRGLQPDAEYVVSRRPSGRPLTVRGSQLMTEGLSVELAQAEAGLWCVAQQP